MASAQRLITERAVQELVAQGKAVGAKMEQLQHSTSLLQAGRAWAAQASEAIDGLPTLMQACPPLESSA